MQCKVIISGKRHTVACTLGHGDPRRMAAIIDGRGVEADAAITSPHAYSILLAGRSFDVLVEEIAAGLLVHVGGRQFQVEIIDPRSRRNARGASIALEGRQEVTATMPGKIVSILASAGQGVHVGQGLVVIEAMKMQNEIRSPKAGTLERLLVKEGQTVSAGEAIAIIT